MISSHYFFILLLLFSKVMAQVEKDSAVIAIDLRWQLEKLELNKNYITNNDTLQFSAIKCYLSNVAIEYENNSVYKEKNRFHLIDIENKKSLQFCIPKNKNPISKIIFNIGIDSLSSVSGALSGDLDVQNGMYWAWQSGYINLKIEGKSSRCKTRKNAFQFHIGGYLKPYYALRTVEIRIEKIQKPSDEINVVIDFRKLFENLQLSETNSILIPGKEAMKIASEFVKTFSVE